MLRRPSSLAIAVGDPGSWSGLTKLASSTPAPPSSACLSLVQGRSCRSILDMPAAAVLESSVPDQLPKRCESLSRRNDAPVGSRHIRTFDHVAHTDRIGYYLVDASHHNSHSVAVAPEVCGHTKPHATQNSFPSGSCITTEYRCRVSVSIRTGWSTVAPRSTSSATLASTVATISSIGAERSATKMSKWNRVLPVFFSGTGWNQILGPSPAGS